MKREKQGLSPRAQQHVVVPEMRKKLQRRKAQCDSSKVWKMWYSGSQIKQVFQEE